MWNWNKIYSSELDQFKYIYMKNATLTRKISRNIEDYGPKIAIKKGLAYLLRPFYNNAVYRIYGIDLRNWEVREVDRDDFIFQIVDGEDSEIINQIEAMEEWLRGKLKAKVEKGRLCLVALDKEQVAGFNLIAFGEVFLPLDRLRKVFEADEAWSEHITVNKGYRRRGLGSDLRYKVFLELRKIGIKKLYGGTFIDNEPNLRLSRKVGFLELNDIHYFKLLGYKKCQYREVNKSVTLKSPMNT